MLYVLQVRLTEVPDLDAGRDVVADEGASRLRQQDLPSVTGGADPCGPDDVQAEVALVAHGRLAGVEAYPYLHLDAFRPFVAGELSLGGHRAIDCVLRAGKREEEGVSLGVHLPAPGQGQLLAQDAPVIAVHLGVAVAELFEEPR